LNKEIEEVKADLNQDKERTTTVRNLLRWFGARRRRTGVVKRIQNELDNAGITTSPDFTKVWIDADISFKKVSATLVNEEISEEGQIEDAPSFLSKDASFLISMLEAANCGVVSVKPQDTIEKAVTLMLAYDFSQLAVMTSEHILKGSISWKTIGKRLSHKNDLNEVKDAMESAVAHKDTLPLFKATKLIIEHEFIFVRSSLNNKVTGIVTATDISEQFQTLSEPFLLIGQIENQIRLLLHGKFSTDVLKNVCNDGDVVRKDSIESIADLTFGEYLRLIQYPDNWEKLCLRIDRNVFCAEMDRVREIRNDVMHFDPDGLDEEQYDQLRRFSNLLDELEALTQQSADSEEIVTSAS
tara:strand:+ start:466 stop:1530 length:1065 start_codon:yes stop_codon:yes gene_type:complete